MNNVYFGITSTYPDGFREKHDYGCLALSKEGQFNLLRGSTANY